MARPRKTTIAKDQIATDLPDLKDISVELLTELIKNENHKSLVEYFIDLEMLYDFSSLPCTRCFSDSRAFLFTRVNGVYKKTDKKNPKYEKFLHNRKTGFRLTCLNQKSPRKRFIFPIVWKCKTKNCGKRFSVLKNSPCTIFLKSKNFKDTLESILKYVKEITPCKKYDRHYEKNLALRRCINRHLMQIYSEEEGMYMPEKWNKDWLDEMIKDREEDGFCRFYGTKAFDEYPVEIDTTLWHLHHRVKDEYEYNDNKYSKYMRVTEKLWILGVIERDVTTDDNMAIYSLKSQIAEDGFKKWTNNAGEMYYKHVLDSENRQDRVIEQANVDRGKTLIEFVKKDTFNSKLMSYRKEKRKSVMRNKRHVRIRLIFRNLSKPTEVNVSRWVSNKSTIYSDSAPMFNSLNEFELDNVRYTYNLNSIVHRKGKIFRHQKGIPTFLHTQTIERFWRYLKQFKRLRINVHRKDLELSLYECKARYEYGDSLLGFVLNSIKNSKNSHIYSYNGKYVKLPFITGNDSVKIKGRSLNYYSPDTNDHADTWDYLISMKGQTNNPQNIETTLGYVEDYLKYYKHTRGKRANIFISMLKGLNDKNRVFSEIDLPHRYSLQYVKDQSEYDKLKELKLKYGIIKSRRGLNKHRNRKNDDENDDDDDDDEDNKDDDDDDDELPKKRKFRSDDSNTESEEDEEKPTTTYNDQNVDTSIFMLDAGTQANVKKPILQITNDIALMIHNASSRYDQLISTELENITRNKDTQELYELLHARTRFSDFMFNISTNQKINYIFNTAEESFARNKKFSYFIIFSLEMAIGTLDNEGFYEFLDEFTSILKKTNDPSTSDFYTCTVNLIKRLSNGISVKKYKLEQELNNQVNEELKSQLQTYLVENRTNRRKIADLERAIGNERDDADSIKYKFKAYKDFIINTWSSVFKEHDSSVITKEYITRTLHDIFTANQGMKSKVSTQEKYIQNIHKGYTAGQEELKNEIETLNQLVAHRTNQIKRLGEFDFEEQALNHKLDKNLLTLNSNIEGLIMKSFTVPTQPYDPITSQYMSIYSKLIKLGKVKMVHESELESLKRNKDVLYKKYSKLCDENIRNMELLKEYDSMKPIVNEQNETIRKLCMEIDRIEREKAVESERLEEIKQTSMSLDSNGLRIEQLETRIHELEEEKETLELTVDNLKLFIVQENQKTTDLHNQYTGVMLNQRHTIDALILHVAKELKQLGTEEGMRIISELSNIKENLTSFDQIKYFYDKLIDFFLDQDRLYNTELVKLTDRVNLLTQEKVMIETEYKTMSIPISNYILFQEGYKDILSLILNNDERDDEDKRFINYLDSVFVRDPITVTLTDLEECNAVCNQLILKHNTRSNIKLDELEINLNTARDDSIQKDEKISDLMYSNNALQNNVSEMERMYQHEREKTNTVISNLKHKLARDSKSEKTERKRNLQLLKGIKDIKEGFDNSIQLKTLDHLKQLEKMHAKDESNKRHITLLNEKIQKHELVVAQLKNTNQTVSLRYAETLELNRALNERIHNIMYEIEKGKKESDRDKTHISNLETEVFKLREERSKGIGNVNREMFNLNKAKEDFNAELKNDLSQLKELLTGNSRDVILSNPELFGELKTVITASKPVETKKLLGLIQQNALRISQGTANLIVQNGEIVLVDETNERINYISDSTLTETYAVIPRLDTDIEYIYSSLINSVAGSVTTDDYILIPIGPTSQTLRVELLDDIYNAGYDINTPRLFVNTSATLTVVSSALYPTYVIHLEPAKKAFDDMNMITGASKDPGNNDPDPTGSIYLASLSDKLNLNIKTTDHFYAVADLHFWNTTEPRKYVLNILGLVLFASKGSFSMYRLAAMGKTFDIFQKETDPAEKVKRNTDELLYILLEFLNEYYYKGNTRMFILFRGLFICGKIVEYFFKFSGIFFTLTDETPVLTLHALEKLVSVNQTNVQLLYTLAKLFNSSISIYATMIKDKNKNMPIEQQIINHFMPYKLVHAWKFTSIGLYGYNYSFRQGSVNIVNDTVEIGLSNSDWDKL